MPQSSINAPTHAVVWLDHRDAKIFLVTPEDVEKQRVKASTPQRQVHHEANDGGSGHVRDDRKFFEAILAELENANAWLIVGPDKTRNDLDKYLDQHAEMLKKRLLGVEAMDHPTDGGLLAQARKLFKAHVHGGART